MTALLVALALAAAPKLEIAPGFEPAAPLGREVTAGWESLAQTWREVTGANDVRAPKLLLERGLRLRSDQAGKSRVGVIELRQTRDGSLTESMVVALRHELAHQFLWVACPQASDDALFHESFALATSGELSAWRDGPYLSMNGARNRLLRAKDPDSRGAREALARLLANEPVDHGLPQVLAQRLRRCADHAAWAALTPAELIEIPLADGDALVVLNRHSGEVLLQQGDARVPLPFGSTLKPFLAAGARAQGPVLPVDAHRAEWACGDDAPKTMDLPTALLRSCNGYFLDWTARAPAIAKLGAFGPVLTRLGLAHLPQDGSEAIGLRPTLKLSPLALAEAYRALGATSPKVLAILAGNAERGTLSGLAASARLHGVALKTGTVRDADSRVGLGWIAAVDDDVVAVMARKGRQPRDFAEAMAAVLARFHGQRAQVGSEVQVLGLVPPDRVQARCSGVGIIAAKDGPALAAGTQLAKLTERGEALCLGAPWMLSFPGGPSKGRAYAGTFRWSPPPAYHPPAGAPTPTERQVRARQGSSFVFQTRLLLYVSGVLAAEDAQIAGEPRVALAQAVAHNAGASRHRGRPVCDTTHCQAFLGTVAPAPGDAAALDGADATPAGWLPFSQGGDAPWSDVRTLAQVARALGAEPLELGFVSNRVRFLVRTRDGDAVYEDHAELPCERLRNPLHLPACPESATIVGRAVHFRGQGRGHGEGLDVEHAKRSALDHQALLREAYPAASSSR